MIKKLSEKGRSKPEIEEGEVQIDEEGNVIESDIGEDPYIKWYENFAPSLKMGIMEDEPNRNKIAKLLRVKTSQSDGKWRSFADVVENMKEFQTTIFYIAGGSVKEVEESPFMDMFNAKGIEVIYFTESADEYMLNHLQEYDGKRFQAISKETIKFGGNFFRLRFFFIFVVFNFKVISNIFNVTIWSHGIVFVVVWNLYFFFRSEEYGMSYKLRIMLHKTTKLYL